MVWSKSNARQPAGGGPDGDRDREAWQLVRGQHGVVTRAQLKALGFHRRSIDHRRIGYEGDVIDVSVRRRCEIHRKGLEVRSRPSLAAGSVVQRYGIPVTDPVQTLIDLTTELKPLQVERAVNEADKHDLVDPETLRAALQSRVGEPGVQ